MRPDRPIWKVFSVINRYRLSMALGIALAWTIVDALFFVFRLSSGPSPNPYSIFEERTASTILLRELNVFVISLFMGFVLIYVMKDFFRNISLSLNLLLKLVILIVVALMMNLFIHCTYATVIAAIPLGEAVDSFYRKTFETRWLLQNMPEWIILFLVTQIMIEISEKYSPGVFLDIMMGRYKQPRDERRIIMFIDLKNSTPVAEKLGHKEYFKFIRDFIRYISTGIMEYGGRIYQYVGDEVVVSWPENRRNARNCVYALIEARKSLHKRLHHFQQSYGVIPEFKAGIHTGEVTIGEIGVIKKDLVMSGDTMNTTARIRTACNELKQKFIASAEFLKFVNLKEWQAEPLGPIELKGKNSSLELFALKL